MLAHQVDGLAPVRSLTRDAQIHMLGKELTQTRAHDGVVIHNANIDHESGLSQSRPACRTAVRGQPAQAPHYPE